MESYQEYKESILACPTLPAIEPPKEYYKNGKEKKQKKVETCHKKSFDGVSVPGYFSYNNVKLLLVLNAPEAETVSQGIAWTSKKEAKITNWLKEAGLYGNNQIGFSYLLKCPVSGLRNSGQAWKYCKANFDEEIKFANNPGIMLVGMETTQLILPKALHPTSETDFMYRYVTYDLNVFGRKYFFLPSVNEIYTSRDNGNEVRSEGDRLLAVSSLVKAAKLLGVSFQK
jgi:uracil-DNA glycosylase